jgi:hypothetical protein
MPTNGKLTLRQRQTDAKITVADWSWVRHGSHRGVNCRTRQNGTDLPVSEQDHSSTAARDDREK